jgi:hypothetical protein
MTPTHRYTNIAATWRRATPLDRLGLAWMGAVLAATLCLTLWSLAITTAAVAALFYLIVWQSQVIADLRARTPHATNPPHPTP